MQNLILKFFGVSQDDAKILTQNSDEYRQLNMSDRDVYSPTWLIRGSFIQNWRKVFAWAFIMNWINNPALFLSGTFCTFFVMPYFLISGR